MNIKRQNHTMLFKGLVLVMAFALAVLCMPTNIINALATMSSYTDYSYMTIGTVDEEVRTTVNRGETYYIPNAYIGGSERMVVGKVANETDIDPSDTTVSTLRSSTVTVSYSNMVLEEHEGNVEEDTDITNQVVVTSEGDNYGYFIASKVGTYTITYSYVYEIGDKTYTNTYELNVNVELASVTINLDENNERFIPSIIDLKLAKEDDGSYMDMKLPLPSVTDEDGEEIEGITYLTDASSIPQGDSDKAVLISVVGGTKSQSVTISGDAETGFYVDGSVFGDANFGAGRYTVRYAYYVGGDFVTATTKTTQVYSEENSYYTDYSLRLQLASDWRDDGQTGVESKLPEATGVTSANTTPASEAVDVYYTVQVQYRNAGSSNSYAPISADEYNIDKNGNEKIDEDEIVVLDENGTLADPTSFKPLNDGWYTFIYTIKDYYDNTVSSTRGVYEFENITDEQNPTPVVYDASIKDEETRYEDASSKLQSRAVPNSVVVYAIGIDDNVSKADDEGVELTRRIMTDDTVVKLTINDYDDKNLIFNYRDTTSAKAFENLTSNNYLIRKATKEQSITNDTQMLAWLKANKYLIVVDNANYKTIFEIFNSEENNLEGDKNFFDGKTINDQTISADNALDWFKTEEALKAGFAYIDSDETFGATTSNGGMGTGQYYIHYIAKDAAGNETDVTRSMYIGSYTDNELPDITFGTTLADSYLPTSTITFNVPTASDNYDSNMLVKTWYRFLDDEGTPIQVSRDGTPVSINDLDEVWTDIENNNIHVTEGDLRNIYSAYHDTTPEANDGYIDLTDASATTYSIDLAEGGADAKQLQILVYTYDDTGLVNVYAETINILNRTDNNPPKFHSIDTEDETFVSEYVQGQEITLPTFVVNDDAVAYMSFDVKVNYVSGEGDSTTRTPVATYDFSSEREVLSQSGAGRYTVHAGKFVAAFAGRYEVSIAVKDSNNNTVVSFVNYEVSPRTIIQPPVISTSMESRTVQLDGDENYDPTVGIEIPTPSVSYQIPNSVTYDEFSANSGAYADTDYVVMGVDKNGRATNWSTTYGQAGSFVPKKIGEYPIQYTVKLTVYNHNVFTWDDMNSEDYTGGYFTYQNNSLTANVVANADGTYSVTQGDNVYTVKKDQNEDYKVYNASNNSLLGDLNGTIFQDVDLNDWANDLTVYTLTSDVYTIIVQDTVGPRFYIDKYDYPDIISDAGSDGYALTIYGIDAIDRSNINASRSRIVLSWTLANGETGSQTFSTNLFANQTYNIRANGGNAVDGTYTITYTVYDNNGNYTTASKEIAVGDNIAPTLTFDDDFVNESYQLGDTLILDPTKIHYSDNKDMPENPEITIRLVNNATSDEEIEYTMVGGNYQFPEFDEVGTYTLTVEVRDAAGNTSTHPGFTIEVTARATNTDTIYRVVGTILIVVSVLILVGVIVYFIVSKVKLDKELKK